MTQYIDKSALVAEIERRISLFRKEKKIEKWSAEASQMNVVSLGARIAMLEEILSLLDTLEVKEVDLEKELDSMITPELKFHKALPSLFDVAKHFFELGMQQSKNDNNNEEKE